MIIMRQLASCSYNYCFSQTFVAKFCDVLISKHLLSDGYMEKLQNDS